MDTTESMAALHRSARRLVRAADQVDGTLTDTLRETAATVAVTVGARYQFSAELVAELEREIAAALLTRLGNVVGQLSDGTVVRAGPSVTLDRQT